MKTVKFLVSLLVATGAVLSLSGCPDHDEKKEVYNLTDEGIAKHDEREQIRNELKQRYGVHLNHKGGTMTSLSARFRSLTMFEVWSYRYYRKHIQMSSWSPMQVVVAAGLSFHLLIFALAQIFVEIAAVARAAAQSKRTMGARTSSE